MGDELVVRIEEPRAELSANVLFSFAPVDIDSAHCGQHRFTGILTTTNPHLPHLTHGGRRRVRRGELEVGADNGAGKGSGSASRLRVERLSYL